MGANRAEPAAERAESHDGRLLVGGVREVPLHRLRPWDRNPRRILPDRLKDLKAALTADPEMLWARPLIALLDGSVICGNQRLLAARELGWVTIPVLFVDLDWERAKVWALRDNNQFGEWDEPMLAELLAELGQGGLDLALAGFESRDLDRILASIPAPKDPDDVPPLSAGEPDSTPGADYALGRHRLACDDSRNKHRVSALLEGEPAEFVCVTWLADA